MEVSLFPNIALDGRAAVVDITERYNSVRKQQLDSLTNYLIKEQGS
jgi:hypothetical protein